MKKIFLIFFFLLITTGCTVSLSQENSNSVQNFESPSLQEKKAVLLFLGDMMLERNVAKAFKKNGGADYLFTKLAAEKFFDGYDAIHANLEGPFANFRRATSKSIAFRFDPALITTLKKYNLSIFSAANNHTLDMGQAGFKESKDNLIKAGLAVYGSQYRVDDESLLIKQVGDFKVGFIGINDTNGQVATEKITDLIKKAKNQGAEKIIINIHWGEEYKEISNTRQRTLARALINTGADVIIGHHPHVVQEMEIYEGRPIFYSLGNFIFDQYFSTPTQQSLAVGLVLKDKEISISVFPLKGVKSQAQLMTGEEKSKFWRGWLAKSSFHGEEFKDNNLELIYDGHPLPPAI